MNIESPKSFALWSVAVLAFGIIGRLGWEIGGKIWGLF